MHDIEIRRRINDLERQIANTEMQIMHANIQIITLVGPIRRRGRPRGSKNKVKKVHSIDAKKRLYANVSGSTEITIS